MKLSVITPENDVVNECTIVTELLQTGVDYIHLRKPGYDIQAIVRYLNGINPIYHRHILVHTAHANIVGQYSVKGLHLPATLRTADAVRNIRQSYPHTFLSTSFHSWDELLDNAMSFNHCFISPLYDSISKTGYKGMIDSKQLASVKSRLQNNDHGNIHITALGGITPANIRQVKENGFDGAAVLGYIWQAASPVKAAELLLKSL